MASLPSPGGHDAKQRSLACAGRTLTFMDVALRPSSRPRRLVFQLFNDICPVTCENFRALCTGEKGKSAEGIKLHYEGSPFHRIVRDGWAQGGDIVSGKGDGGISIYGGAVFCDEAFTMGLNETGVLAMANKGPHTNASQFLVTLAPQPWLNRRVVGFGRLITGIKTLREMNIIELENERPVKDCSIIKCGELTPAEYAGDVCK